MPLFPTVAWMEAFCDNLRAHPDAGTVASALSGHYRFVIEPAGPVDRRYTYDVSIASTQGGETGGDAAGAVVTLEEPDSAANPTLVPTLVLTADYERWRQLILGELDITMALLLRRIKVNGDLGRLTSNLGSAQPLVAALTGVDTQWPNGRG